MTKEEGAPETSLNLAIASTDELYRLLEEIRQTGSRARIEELQLRAQEGLSESRNRIALLEGIVAAGYARQLHNNGSLGEKDGE